jgi:hypothetical protein
VKTGSLKLITKKPTTKASTKLISLGPEMSTAADDTMLVNWVNSKLNRVYSDNEYRTHRTQLAELVHDSVEIENSPLSILRAHINRDAFQLRNDHCLLSDVTLQQRLCSILFNYDINCLKLGLETVTGLVIPFHVTSRQTLKSHIMTHLLGISSANQQALLHWSVVNADKARVLKQELQHGLLYRLFKLVYVLDCAKGTIRNFPLLFTSKAQIKTSAETVIDEPTKADAPHPHSSTIFSTFYDKGCAHREKMQEARAGAGAPTVRGSLAHSHSKSSPRIPKTAQKSKHDSSVTADVGAGLNIIPHNLQRRLEQRYGSTYRSDLVSVFNSRTSVGTPIQRAGSSSHPNSVNNSAENLLGISAASATPTQLPNREDYNHNNSSVMHFSTQTSTPQYHHLGADSSFKTHLTSPSTAMYANGDLGVDFQSGSASAVPGISFLSEDDKLAHVQALTHINTQVNASLGPSSYTQGTPAPVTAMDVVTSNFVHSAKKVDISMALSQTLQLQVKIVYLEGYLIIAVVINCFTV